MSTIVLSVTWVPHFTDVPANFWGYAPIETLYNANVLTHTPTFGRLSGISRAELASWLVTAIREQHALIHAPSQSGPRYYDDGTPMP